MADATNPFTGSNPFSATSSSSSVAKAPAPAPSVTQKAAGALRNSLSKPRKATIWNADTGLKMVVELDSAGKMLDSYKSQISEKIGGAGKSSKWSLWTGGKASGPTARDAITRKNAMNFTPDTSRTSADYEKSRRQFAAGELFKASTTPAK